jgi:alginate O-acetyltransferase complex protein AlgJ
MQIKNTYNNYILSTLFVLMLIAPNAVLLINIKTGTAPKLNVNENNSLKEFKDYYTENFGFKTSLANSYLNLKTSTLNEVALPDRVVIGRNNWFFLGNYYNNTLNDALGWSTIKDYQVNNILNKLNNINDYLSSKNIAFYVVVAPNKNNIYNENLPFHTKKGSTVLQQFKSNLKNSKDLKFIDLSESLKRKKSINNLYIKSDTHWNELGAYYGYSEIIAEIKKDIDVPLVPLSAYEVVDTFQQFDLTNMINYKFIDIKIELEKIEPTKAKSIRPDKNIYRHYINPEKDKVLVLHRDSFANALTQFFNESFGESYYLKNYKLNKELIEKVKPDLVIFEIVERNLINWAN